MLTGKSLNSSLVPTSSDSVYQIVVVVSTSVQVATSTNGYTPVDAVTAARKLWLDGVQVACALLLIICTPAVA